MAPPWGRLQAFLIRLTTNSRTGGAGNGRDQGTDQTAPGGQAEQAEQESTDHGTQDADDDIAEYAEAAAAHEQAGEPTGRGAHE